MRLRLHEELLRRVTDNGVDTVDQAVELVRSEALCEVIASYLLETRVRFVDRAGIGQLCHQLPAAGHGGHRDDLDRRSLAPRGRNAHRVERSLRPVDTD